MTEAVLESPSTKIEEQWIELHSKITTLPTEAPFRSVVFSQLPTTLRAIAAVSGLNLSHQVLGKLELVEDLITQEVDPVLSLYSNGQAEAEEIRCLIIIPRRQPTLLNAELLNRRGEQVKPRRILGESGFSYDLGLSSSICAAKLIKTISGFSDSERLAVLEEVVSLVKP